MTTRHDAASPGRVRQLWLTPEAGANIHGPVAEVAVAARTHELKAFAVPQALRDRVGAGTWVRVPFGRRGRIVDGVCVRVSEGNWDQGGPVVDDVLGAPRLSRALIELGLWLGEYYAVTPWSALCVILPGPVRRAQMRTENRVRVSQAAANAATTPRRRAGLEALAGRELRLAEAAAASGLSPDTIRALCRAGLLERFQQPVAEPAPWPPGRDEAPAAALAPAPEDELVLSPEQQRATEEVAQALASPQPFGVFLLFGVPGSGKTEVYVRLLREVIRRGRQGMLLIPEIALTTQLVQRLARRFARVAVVHSRMSARHRRSAWEAIAAGQVDLVIGTRAAVFAPCPKLGLIVVDEEQEASFKNLAAPYYHARDVAIKRAQLENVPVVLGSATPALESWFNAQHRAHYRLLRLPQRVAGAAMPQVRLAAWHAPREGEARSLLTETLHNALDEALRDGHQAILLHNRRGHSRWLRCQRCGLALRCQRCDRALVLHRAAELLVCHQCGMRSLPPQCCADDSCRGPLEPAGAGVERLEDELRATWPQARLLRLDRDTLRRREDYERALESFSRNEADVLLGTQMVAKGLDFPRVRLVGVVDAEHALRLPDFRAAERLFQLLVQVVGRAGRSGGTAQAIIQTTPRPAQVVHRAIRMDYESFAAEELKAREQLELPPVRRLVRLICADDRARRARVAAQQVADQLRERAGRISAELQVSAAALCPVSRVRGRRRYEILIRGPRGGNAMSELLRILVRDTSLRPSVQRFAIDVDPVEML